MEIKRINFRRGGYMEIYRTGEIEGTLYHSGSGWRKVEITREVKIADNVMFVDATGSPAPSGVFTITEVRRLYKMGPKRIPHDEAKEILERELVAVVTTRRYH